MQWLQPMPVRDRMHRDPVVVRADAPIAVATDLLRTRKIRHLPVVDEQGRLVGIVTDRDLRQVVFDPRIQDVLGDATLALRALTVREVMTWGVVSVRADDDLRAAVRLMRERKIGALPVVDNGLVVGILTERDVLAALEALLGTQLATIRPLAPPPEGAEPYDYGFPIPGVADGHPEQGIID
jgi:acetoin utilization protein AcuB